MSTKNSSVNNATAALSARIYDKCAQSNINITITDIVKIPLEKLRDNSNSVRPSGECFDTVAKMVETIKNGDYDPYRYIAPIVEKTDDDKYVIISGHHRYKAHQTLELDSMLCVVVKFNDERERNIWRQLENTESFDGFVKSVATREEHVACVSNLVNKGVIGKDRKAIQEYLVDAKIVSKKAEKSINTIVNEVLKKTGNHYSYDYVHSWESGAKKEIVDVLQNKIKDRKFINATFKEKDDVDYDHRTMLQIIDAFVENPERPIVVVYAVNGANKEKLEDIRKYKPTHLVPSFLKRWNDVQALQEAGHDLNEMVTLEPLPQLGSEVSVSKSNGAEEFISACEKKYSNKDEMAEKLMEVMLNSKGDELKQRIKQLLSGEDVLPREVVQ